MNKTNSLCCWDDDGSLFPRELPGAAQDMIMNQLKQDGSDQKYSTKLAHRSIHCTQSGGKAALAEARRRELICVDHIRVAEVDCCRLRPMWWLPATHDPPCDASLYNSSQW